MPHTAYLMPSVVWIIDADHWPRALLRAELIERGYDAVGFLGIDDALHAAPDRFPDVIVVEMHGLELTPEDAAKLFELGRPVVLLAGAIEVNEAWLDEFPWAAILRRPVAIGDIADAVQRLRAVQR